MFAGQFDLTLDSKNRLVLPTKFRIFITQQDRSGLFILARPVGQERCLRLCPPAYMERVKANMIKLAGQADAPEEFLRAVTSRMEFAPVDAQSRFVVPQKLVEFAGLSRDVVMVGLADWIEVWNLKEWETVAERAREKHPELLKRALWPEP